MSDQTAPLSCLAEESDDIQITLTKSHRNVLASVSIELQSDLGRISIRDARILRNRSGVAWFSLPTFSVTKGREFEYLPTIELSPTLQPRVSEKALAEFERWEKTQTQLGGAQCAAIPTQSPRASCRRAFGKSLALIQAFSSRTKRPQTRSSQARWPNLQPRPAT